MLSDEFSKAVFDALKYISKTFLKGSEILIHENTKGLTFKYLKKKYIFLGDGKVIISEKSDKGLVNTMKEESIL